MSSSDPGPGEWHPEAQLIDIRDEAVSRPALERLGTTAWNTALDYLYRHGLARGMGLPPSYGELRRLWFGAAGGPGPAPDEPTVSADLLADFEARLAPHLLNAWHPGTHAYFTPPPLMLSVVGELLAQVTQQGIDVWHAGPSGAFVEEEVVRWLCDLVGFGPASFGLLTSGGVMANLLALALARDIHLRGLLDLEGPPRGAQLETARFYVSDQAHFSIRRSLGLLGFGRESLVVLPSDERFRLRSDPVASAVDDDRRAGLLPVAIAAVAGSTNTGSVDDVPALAELARREDLWLHVDAAYGGAARLSERDRGRVPGLELADSVTLDPHKWFFQAYDIGGLLVRDGGWLAEVFADRPEYYRTGSVPPAESEGETTWPREAHSLDFYRLGLEGTRRFRALKLWLSWRHLGTPGLGRLVERNDDLAAALAERIAASDDFEACPPRPELSVVCFRHLPWWWRDRGPTGSTGREELDALDAHQDALQAALERDGSGWLSTTRLRGATWLRAGILNYMSSEADIEALLASLRELAGSR